MFPLQSILDGAAASLLLAPTLCAQVTVLASFAGAQHEGFETQHESVGGQHPPAGAPYLLGALFGGTASLEALTNPFLVQVHGGALSSCQSSHRSGDFQAASFAGDCAIQLTNDQAALGGYFASNRIDPIGRTRSDPGLRRRG